MPLDYSIERRSSRNTRNTRSEVTNNFNTTYPYNPLRSTRTPFGELAAHIDLEMRDRGFNFRTKKGFTIAKPFLHMWNDRHNGDFSELTDDMRKIAVVAINFYNEHQNFTM